MALRLCPENGFIPFEYQTMNSIYFSTSDTVTVNLRDLTKYALAWAVGEACSVPLSVVIGDDYSWLSITADRLYDCLGESQEWQPHLDWDQVGPRIFEAKISTWTNDGVVWHGRSFVNHLAVFDADDPMSAACLVLIYQHAGDTVSVPRQLQEFDRCKLAYEAAQAQSVRDARSDDAAERLYALENRFR